MQQTYTPTSNVDWGKGRWGDEQGDLRGAVAARNPDTPHALAGFEVATDPSGVQWYHSADNPGLGYQAAYGTSDYLSDGGVHWGGSQMGVNPTGAGSNPPAGLYNPATWYQGVQSPGHADWLAGQHENYWGGYTGAGDSAVPDRNFISGASWTDDPTGQWWYDDDLADNLAATGGMISRGEGISQLAESISGGEDSNIGTELYDPLIEAQALHDAMGGEGSGGGEGSLETNAAGELTQESIDELLADMPKDVEYRGGVGISPIQRGGYDSEKRDAMEGELNTPSLQDFIRNMSGFGNIENGMSAYLGDSTEGEIDYSTRQGNWQGPLKSSPGYTDYILQMLAGASDKGFGTLPIMDPPSVPTPPVPPTTY